jgi:uncharacterized protein YbaP (TraB family)
LAAAAGAAGCSSLPQAAPSAGWPLWVLKSSSGTVHLTGETPPGRSDWSDSRIEKTLSKCATLWTETSKVVRAPLGPLVVRYGIDPKTPLMSRLNATDRAGLEKAAAIAGLPLARLTQFRPWLAAQQLEEAYYKAKGRTGLSANQVLSSEAAKAGLTIRSEFPAQDDLITWFGGLSPDLDLQRLRETIDDVLASDADTQRIDEAWARGDTAPAAAEVARIKPLYPDLYDVLLLKRNRDWVPRIQSMLKEPTASLVVVGNYHLVGPDGIVAQLRTASLHARRV